MIICLLCRQRIENAQEHAHLDEKTIPMSQWQKWQEIYTRGVEHGRSLLKKIVLR